MSPLLTEDDVRSWPHPYQMLIMHEKHGQTTKEFPVFSLGTMRLQEAWILASYLATATAEACVDLREADEVHNIMEAWGCPEFRCWLLPVDVTTPSGATSLPALAIGNEGIFEPPADQDPR